jgi:hypothetical protein
MAQPSYLRAHLWQGTKKRTPRAYVDREFKAPGNKAKTAKETQGAKGTKTGERNIGARAENLRSCPDANGQAEQGTASGRKTKQRYKALRTV